jgi:hypothetical protein
MLAVVGRPGEVPGWDVRLPAAHGGRLAGAVDVRDGSTGSAATVPVVAERLPRAAPTCRAGDAPFGLGDLFGVQREALLDALDGDARDATVRALDPLRPVLDPLLAGDVALPPDLAGLLGREAAEAIVDGLGRGTPVGALVEAAGAARRRGAVLPADRLAPRLAEAVEERVRALPGGAADAIALLDLARAADVRLDLGRAQAMAFRWWLSARPEVDSDPPLAALRERLAIAPEEP